jgi:two-component system chemotaxis response regulator CheY
MAKILVVDDSEAIRNQLKKDLESAGHTVIEAGDGQDGINKLKANEGIQLILCDVNMPVMDGLSMCENIFAIEQYRSIPKFMLTTEANAEMKAKAKAAGVTAWIVKPYVIDKLLTAIKKVVT